MHFVLPLFAVALLSGVASGSLVRADTACHGLLKQDEIEACLEVRHERSGETVADAFEALLASATEPSLHAYLVDGQVSWREARDAACPAEGADYEGGSMQPSVIMRCLASANEARTAAILQVIDEGLKARGHGLETGPETGPLPRPLPGPLPCLARSPMPPSLRRRPTDRLRGRAHAQTSLSGPAARRPCQLLEIVALARTGDDRDLTGSPGMPSAGQAQDARHRVTLPTAEWPADIRERLQLALAAHSAHQCPSPWQRNGTVAEGGARRGRPARSRHHGTLARADRDPRSNRPGRGVTGRRGGVSGGHSGALRWWRKAACPQQAGQARGVDRTQPGTLARRLEGPGRAAPVDRSRSRR